MKRKVLLIGSPLSGRHFLIGVKNDIENFFRYVTSSIGGGYTSDEIKILEHPTISEVKNVLTTFNNSAIVTIYFSGHGFRSNKEDYIWLTHDTYFPVKSLFTTAKRHLVFIDACRIPYDTREIGDVISGIGFHFSTEHIELSRKLYCHYINKSPLGGALVFATSKGQPAFDSESGGVYTNSLMTTLHNWSNTCNEKMITVEQAFHRSSIITREHKPKQLPKIYYCKTRTALHIPIGINPKGHIKQKPRNEIKPSELLRLLAGRR